MSVVTPEAEITGVRPLKIVLAAIEVIAASAAVFFGYLWFIEPLGNNEPPFAIAAFVSVIAELIRRVTPSRGIDPEKISDFIREGQALRARLREEPLPVQEHNDWVERMVGYFKQHKGRAYEVRLSDFSGMTFYGDGSERSRMGNSIDGRVRRMHEFISELGSK